MAPANDKHDTLWTCPLTLICTFIIDLVTNMASRYVLLWRLELLLLRRLELLLLELLLRRAQAARLLLGTKHAQDHKSPKAPPVVLQRAHVYR